MNRRTLFARGLAKRCPRCGAGKLFVRWWTMTPECPRCGLYFERDPGYWVGAMIVNTAVTIGVFLVTFVGVMVLTWPDVPWQATLIGTMLLNLVVPVVFYPWSKTLFVAMDLAVRPVGDGEAGVPGTPVD